MFIARSIEAQLNPRGVTQTDIHLSPRWGLPDGGNL